jgi:hypothetical protein
MAEIVVIHVAIGLITDNRNGSEAEFATAVPSVDLSCTSNVEFPDAITRSLIGTINLDCAGIVTSRIGETVTLPLSGETTTDTVTSLLKPLTIVIGIFSRTDVMVYLPTTIRNFLFKD